MDRGCSTKVKMLGISTIVVSMLSVLLSFLVYNKIHRLFYLFMALIWIVLFLLVVKVYMSLNCTLSTESS